MVTFIQMKHEIDNVVYKYHIIVFTELIDFETESEQKKKIDMKREKKKNKQINLKMEHRFFFIPLSDSFL